MSFKLVQGLLDFVGDSPTPFHAAYSMAKQLEAAGFQLLNEYDEWLAQPAGRYYIIRGGSSIVAFVVGSNPIEETGVRLVGAHTDSPCLKVKPTPELVKKGYAQLGVEVYGGALLNPWFDRDLSIAGLVTYLTRSGELCSTRLNLCKPVACIPSLAIHLDREANQNRSVNPQKDMNAILYQGEQPKSLRTILLESLDEPEVEEILDFNLSFYDTQRPAVVGLKEEFVASARLDNLLSCYLGMQAIIAAGEEHTSVLICNDHEEVGSNSDIGAQGPLLQELLERLAPSSAQRQRALRRSVMFSVDNAHGVHPNYVQKHDEQHGPQLNKGPVIKFDANQGYATNSPTASLVRWLARGGSVESTHSDAGTDIPLQTYVTRADMRCGSTIGPLTAAGIGLTTVDLGVPTFAMHSIRELAGTTDLAYMYRLLSRFYRAQALPSLVGA